MDLASILLERTGDHIATVTVNRPGRLNAVDFDTATQLKRVMSDVAGDTTVRAVIVTGAGEKAFVVGADKSETALHGDEERAASFENVCRDAFNLIAGMDKPVVCAINGYAFGLGVQLALACTFRIACSGARFGLPEVNMGFLPSMGATQRLTRLVGEARSMEMILTGKTIEVEEALRIGLVHRIVPLPELFGVAQSLAAELSEKDPLVLKLAMRAIRAAKEMGITEGLAYEAELAKECGRHESGAESDKSGGENAGRPKAGA